MSGESEEHAYPLLRNKVAVVTGSGQGIGKAIAIALAEHGAKIVVNNRSPESTGGNAEATANSIRDLGGEAIAVYGDVSRMDVCENLIRTAVDRWGAVHILVNNAGINRDRMIWNMSEEEWDEVIDVVLKGTFGCTKYASALMRQQKSGCIINLTSQAGLDGNSGQPNYSAAKAGVVGLTKSCALALKKYGITVNCISPQAGTRMWQSVTPNRAREMGIFRGLISQEEAASIPDESVSSTIFGSPEDIAPLVVYLASDEAKAITGHIFFASGGQVGLYGSLFQTKTIRKKGRWKSKELSSAIPGMFSKE